MKDLFEIKNDQYNFKRDVLLQRGNFMFCMTQKQLPL